MLTGKKILLDTTKYDGSLHYRFDTTVVFHQESVLGVYREPDLMLESHRGSFIAPGHVLNIFYSNAYHNVVIMWDGDWAPRMHYVNIATPATWDTKRVTAADLDLDLIRFAGEKKIILDDEDEFEEHQKSMRYPQELIQKCLAEVDVLTRAVATQKGIFSDDIYNWRPGTSLALEHISVPA